MRRLPVTALSVLVIAACATGPTVPPSVDVTGVWRGTWEFEPVHLGSGGVVADLKQNGSKVTGDLSVTGPARTRPFKFDGIVSGDDLRMLGPEVAGWLKVTGNEMTGEVYGVVPARVTVRRSMNAR